jgi:serine/threonine protein kinase
MRPLGAGGMAEVWKARETRLDRAVAIKVLPPDLTTDAAARQRFEWEAVPWRRSSLHGHGKARRSEIGRR